MRKQTITIRCDGDGCREFMDVENLRDTPVGWYRVALAVEGHSNETRESGNWDFHDLRCVERWAKGRRSALDGNGENAPSARIAHVRGRTVYPRIECPVCGKFMATQGFTMHWATQHQTELGERPQMDTLKKEATDGD